MSIILIGGEKGGTGKTTLAVNLAARRALQGRDVLLIDTDIRPAPATGRRAATSPGYGLVWPASKSSARGYKPRCAIWRHAIRTSLSTRGGEIRWNCEQR